MSKILYVASNMTHINNFHLEYIASLRSLGHTVSVMARGDGADYDIPFEKKLFSSKNTECRRKIKRIISEGCFDAIILNTTLAAFHVRFALPRKNRPRVINIVHGYLFSENTGFIKRSLLLFCEKLVASKTDALILMNAEDEAIAKKHRLCRDGISMIDGLGVSVREVMTPPETIKASYGEGKYAMLFVGELSDRKNQEFLIRALPNIKEHIPNAVLWLVGDGAERAKLNSVARECGVEESVVLFGKRSDACDFMRAADLYVSAARIEGLPFNIVEALGCGRYVVASCIKGHRDVINSTRVGLLYSEGAEDTFVKAVLLSYKERRDGNADSYARYEFYEKTRVFPLVLQTIVDNLKGL